MYPTDGGIKIHAGRQATILCGASRPGHFDGVLQVVTKLFHLAEPTRAYFGQKDAQQVAIVETLVRDFNFPLEIRKVPIVREEDGLAKSSRNVYLSEAERKEAPAIFAALKLARDEYFKEENAEKAIEKATDYILTNTSGRIDYIELLSYPDLKPVEPSTTQFLLAAAVYIGKTRLIDNIIFNKKGKQIMFREMMNAKIHRAQVTEANLNYVGSITIDADILDAVGMLPNEKVQVVNNNNGARFETYIIEGERGSGVICVNGAAARLVEEGDIVIIISYAYVDEKELRDHKPTVAIMGEHNSIKEIIHYEPEATVL